jgi:hypothetical protein
LTRCSTLRVNLPSRPTERNGCGAINVGRWLCWTPRRGEVCHGQAVAPGRVVRGATLPPRGHPAMRAVVSSVQAQLA